MTRLSSEPVIDFGGAFVYICKDWFAPHLNMWVARCYLHQETKVIPYWSFGATLGAVQEHIRREHRAPREIWSYPGIEPGWVDWRESNPHILRHKQALGH